MLIDDVKIRIVAGKGGRGAVAFNKNALSYGPAGGSGGVGGSVIAEGVSDLSALAQFRFKKAAAAENGLDGKAQFRDGRNGEDCVIKIPVGTIIHNLDDRSDIEITKIGERVVLARGGKGGKGNFLFRSSRNRSPRQFQPGLPGEGFSARLELKLIADVGFVGLPNAGKTSLLNALTRAGSRVANYPFTTLEPNLGAYYDMILADIPGLIEGSSAGKGLGIKFLRHIERTRILFHLISSESADPAKDYRTIRKELGTYSHALLKKPEFVFLTKIDLIAHDALPGALAAVQALHANAEMISIRDDAGLGRVREILNGIQKEKFSV